MRHWERVWEILSDEPSGSALASLRVEAASMILRLGVRQGIPLDRAQRIFDEGQALARAQGDSRALIGLLYGYGVAAFLLNGSAPDGIPVFEEAVVIADADGDPELRWAAREPLVTSWFYVGELEKAVRVSDELMDICRDDVFMEIPVTSFTAAWGLGPRGWALLELGRFEEAAECFRRGVEAYDKIGEKEQASWISAFRARCLARMGDVEGALASSQRAVGLAEEVGSHLALVNAYGHHGVALVFAGEWRAAAARLLAGVRMYRAVPSW